MPRRVSLPAADDLFRPTATSSTDPAESAGREAEDPPRQARKQPSGRVRHDEKMTVYVTAQELLDLEHTRLTLRTQGVSVDRGRLVREAVALVLADFEANGQDSLLARRLTGS